MYRLRSTLARMEGSARLLTAIKLGNVALMMIWGFALTFVFVRVLPLRDFQSFLLLIAFGNFTVSAELGLTNIIYARLRRHWLGLNQDDRGEFRPEELGMLFGFLVLLIAAGSAILVAAIAFGALHTGVPLLFLLLFLSACFNLPALLAKRALSAIDENLTWEILDFVRRLVTIMLLLWILLGLDPRLSVAIQLCISLVIISLAMAVIHRRLDMELKSWIAIRTGGMHMKAHYLRDVGISASFNISEVLAYTAPYFTIAMAAQDARPMLIFDFFFKISRALSMLIRAPIEALMPRITSAFHHQDWNHLRKLMIRASGVALLFSAGTGGALLILGKWTFTILFDGRATIGFPELLLMYLALLALAIICVSVYIHGALGHFSLLLNRSIPFLCGSLLSVPVAWSLASFDFDLAFLTCYVLTMVVAAGMHARSIGGLLKRGA